ncbi:MAG: 4-aminobutyrate--2-oxoglutarate transaminase [Mycobacteriaceae bacterium]
MLDLECRLPQVRKMVTDFPGPVSTELAVRRRNAVSAGVVSVVPLYAADASGAIIVDVDGNSLIDLGSGIAVTTVGASNAEVATAVTHQLKSFTHTCFMVTPYESYIAVAEQLAELTPGNHEKRSVLFNSGAEAVENAVKVARSATGRNAIVAFDHAYHGRTNLTMGLTAKAMPYKAHFGPFAPEIYRAPMSYPYRDGLTGPEAAQRAIASIERQVGADSVAAIIIEPIQGEGGFIVPAEGFLPILAHWAQENGVVFIADEVQSGFARTGSWFACDHENIVPDIVTMAKGIAGGLPLAAITGRAELMDAVHPSGLGGTYGGNPVACVAALATIDYMKDYDLLLRAQQIEDIVFPRLKTLAAEVGIIGDIRGRGAMIAMEFVHRGSTEPDQKIAKSIADLCLSSGVIVLTCGTFGNVIRLLPPLVISKTLLSEALDVIDRVVRSLASKEQDGTS